MDKKKEIQRRFGQRMTDAQYLSLGYALDELEKYLIEKACEWLKKYGDDFGVPESESGKVYVDDLVYEIRKAMEE